MVLKVGDDDDVETTVFASGDLGSSFSSCLERETFKAG